VFRVYLLTDPAPVPSSVCLATPVCATKVFIFAAAWAFGGHLPRAGSEDAVGSISDGGGGGGAGPKRRGSKSSGGGGGGAHGPFGMNCASHFSDWWRAEFKQGSKFPRQVFFLNMLSNQTIDVEAV